MPTPTPADGSGCYSINRCNAFTVPTHVSPQPSPLAVESPTAGTKCMNEPWLCPHEGTPRLHQDQQLRKGATSPRMEGLGGAFSFRWLLDELARAHDRELQEVANAVQPWIRSPLQSPRTPPVEDASTSSPYPINAVTSSALLSTPRSLTAAPPDSAVELSAFYQMLKAEFVAVRLQLDDVAGGQADLKSAIDKIQDNLDLSSPGSPQHSSRASRILHAFHNENALPVRVTTDTQANFTGDPETFLDATKAMDQTIASVLTTNADNRRKASLERLGSLIDLSNTRQQQENYAHEEFQRATYAQRVMLLKMTTKEVILDAMMSLAIIANVVFIGVSSDHWDGEINTYFWIDCGFANLFILELVLQLQLHGCRAHFCGKDAFSNIFDIALIILDTIQLVLVVTSKKTTQSLEEAGVPSASLFRTIRLVRVIRILRILRHEAFQDMLAMMEGVVRGMRTLGAAMLVFVLVVYVVALLCKELFGGDPTVPEVYLYFNNVARSMYTVFRCGFGDCSTISGTPIPEFIQEAYGASYSMFYGLFVFFVTIGLFNVISAVFVDTTMSRAAEDHQKMLRHRFADEELWATRVCVVVRRCLVHVGTLQEDDPLQPEMLRVDIPRNIMDHVCQHDCEAMKALDDLDIDPDDHRKLADLLDPDHSGGIGFSELVKGLQSLRGQPRRSDVVVVDLMIRVMQEKLDDILTVVLENAAETEHLKEALATKRSALEERIIQKQLIGKRSNDSATTRN